MYPSAHVISSNKSILASFPRLFSISARFVYINNSRESPRLQGLVIPQLSVSLLQNVLYYRMYCTYMTFRVYVSMCYCYSCFCYRPSLLPWLSSQNLYHTHFLTLPMEVQSSLKQSQNSQSICVHSATDTHALQCNVLPILVASYEALGNNI